MSRKHVMVMLATGLVSGSVAPALAQQNWDTIQIRSERVAAGVYLLVGSGGNIGLSVGDDGVFLVDDQYAPLTEKIVTAIRALSSRPIRFVLNTHYHGDHTGGNENLGKAGALIVAHENVRRRMAVDQLQELYGRTVPASPRLALPVVTFTEALTFHWNGEEIHGFHVRNAHTDGDAVIHFRNADVIHMGDTFFNGRYPFIDIESGGSVDGVIATADLVLGMASETTKIIPGHGPLAKRNDLKTYRDMLADVRGRIAALVGQGRTEDQVVAASVTASWSEKFTGSPERFIRLMYTELSRGTTRDQRGSPETKGPSRPSGLIR